MPGAVWLWLSFPYVMDQASVPAGSDFILKFDGESYQGISSEWLLPEEFKVTFALLPGPVGAITLDYVKGVIPLRVLGGGAYESWAGMPVTDVT